MRRECAGKLKERLLLGVFTLVLVAMFGLFWVFVSHAESQGKVTARSAKIRKEASTSSDVVGGAQNGEVVTVVGQVNGADGKVWYEVKTDKVTGYIRSDLLEVTGEVPPSGEGEPGGNDVPPVDVRPLNPVSATVTRDSGRIRSNASVSSQIVVEVPNGLVLTVTGDATDADGSVWYQVNYNSGESEVNGFIRSDYVTLAGDLSPVTPDAPPANPDEPQEPAQPDKPYDTTLWEGEWHLYNTATNEAYKIDTLFESMENANTYATMYEELAKSEKNQKIIIIVLVFLLVGAVAGIAFLVFKIKDMMDAAYFSEVENDTLRRRKAASQGGGQRTLHAVGGVESQQPRNAGGRQQGLNQKNAGTSQRQGASQGTRAQGQRMPQEERRQPMSQGQRMSQEERRQPVSQGQRMSQEERRQPVSQGQRMSQEERRQPVSQGQRMSQEERRQPVSQGQRMSQDERRQPEPQRQRVPGMPGQRQSVDQGQRAQRPMGVPQSARPVQQAQEDAEGTQRRSGQQAQGWQAKNFMADEEEEFELGFLNYDEEQ